MKALATALVFIPLFLFFGRAPDTGQSSAQGRTDLTVLLPGVARVEVIAPGGEGPFFFEVHYKDGRSEQISADRFAEMSYRSQEERPWWQRLMNISSPMGVAWVTLGLLGQVLFTGRMLVQWLASERAKRSVVPVSFWWMSMGGATMLLIYFVWRKDMVGVLGQSTGWFIYGRNLWFIHRGTAPALGK